MERNNNELVATWGTWAHAQGYLGWLSFAYKRFEGKVLEPGPMGPGSF